MSTHPTVQGRICISFIHLYKSYLWQYHSPWHREHRFAASLPQDPHFGFSGSKLSITSKLYVWASLVKQTNKTHLSHKHNINGWSQLIVRPVYYSNYYLILFTSVPESSDHSPLGWNFLWLDTLLSPSISQNSLSQCSSIFLASVHGATLRLNAQGEAMEMCVQVYVHTCSKMSSFFGGAGSVTARWARKRCSSTRLGSWSISTSVKKPRS